MCKPAEARILTKNGQARFQDGKLVLNIMPGDVQIHQCWEGHLPRMASEGLMLVSVDGPYTWSPAPKGSLLPFHEVTFKLDGPLTQDELVERLREMLLNNLPDTSRRDRTLYSSFRVAESLECVEGSGGINLTYHIGILVFCAWVV